MPIYLNGKNIKKLNYDNNTLVYKVIKGNYFLVVIMFKDGKDFAAYACDRNGMIINKKELIFKQYHDSSNAFEMYKKLIMKLANKDVSSKYFANRRDRSNIMQELPPGRDFYDVIHNKNKNIIESNKYPKDKEALQYKNEYRKRYEEFNKRLFKDIN